MVTREEYTAAEVHLAKLLNIRYGEEEDRGVIYDVGPRWMNSNGDAFALMAQHLQGYYEARTGSADHCIVISNGTDHATVVYLRDHACKKDALRFTIVKAVTAKVEEATRRKRAPLPALITD